MVPFLLNPPMRAAGNHRNVFSPAARFIEKGPDALLELEVPGVDSETIAVDVFEDTVTVSGERPSFTETDGEKLVADEWAAGKFSRTFKLGTRLDPAAVTAHLDNGILTVSLTAFAEKSKPVRVQVKETSHSSISDSALHTENGTI